MYDFGRSETKVEQKSERSEETMNLSFDQYIELRNFLSKEDVAALLKYMNEMGEKIRRDRLRKQQMDEERQRKEKAELEKQRKRELADLMRQAMIHLRRGRSVNY